jgi:hypothetical protein
VRRTATGARTGCVQSGKDVNQAMAALSAAFGQTEAELVRPLMARIAYTQGERADVFADARQAIAVVATAAWRVAQDGGYLTDNLLFDEIARRWSPTYERALIESAATRPNQMRPETLEAALADIRAQGLRLGRLIALARCDVRGWYKPVLAAKGWRVKPLRKSDATSRLVLAGNIPPRTEVETRPQSLSRIAKRGHSQEMAKQSTVDHLLRKLSAV